MHQMPKAAECIAQDSLRAAGTTRVFTCGVFRLSSERGRNSDIRKHHGLSWPNPAVCQLKTALKLPCTAKLRMLKPRQRHEEALKVLSVPDIITTYFLCQFKQLMSLCRNALDTLQCLATEAFRRASCALCTFAM